MRALLRWIWRVMTVGDWYAAEDPADVSVDQPEPVRRQPPEMIGHNPTRQRRKRLRKMIHEEHHT
jgi:hypothetical protein